MSRFESYYDSDDDVSWGPLTLREINRYVMRIRSKEDIGCRRSVGCVPSFIDDLEKRADEITGTQSGPMEVAMPLQLITLDESQLCTDSDSDSVIILSPEEEEVIEVSDSCPESPNEKDSSKEICKLDDILIKRN